MATIPLREYLNGIEELIDGEQFDEALEHCRFILEHYPKHIDTYRMMAKGYLEAHQYDEAKDLFQRVLSSCPDDFVSHIGMSIIAEEGKNLDSAIWHMERAFEAQPSNRSVQEELRRLYGQREGYAPPKVRLTRGALARMYVHGDLFNQAISEIRSALNEDAQRPDLQVLLAEMYLKTNQETEAIEACQTLIQQLPYCLFANRAMAQILRTNQRDVEAAPYQERVEELDPYAALTDAFTPAESMPADSVMIEQMEIKHTTAELRPTPQAWTSSLQMPEIEAEDLPDWLSSEPAGEEPQEAAPEAAPDGSTTLNELEGLQPATPQEDISEPSPFSKVPTAALSEDQVPDWLRDLGPATGTLSGDPENEENVRWTDELRSAGLQPTGEMPAEAVEDQAPSEEQPLSGETRQLSREELAQDDEGLSWLEGLAEEQGADEDELLTSPEERQQAQPDWAPLSEEGEPESDALSWLDSIEDAKEETPAEDPVEQPAAEEEWQSQATPAQPLETNPASPFIEDTQPRSAFEEEEPSPEDARLDALNETPTASGSDPASTTPAWLRELTDQADLEEVAAEPRPLDDAPDWLKELRPEAGAEAEEAEATEDEEPAGFETEDEDTEPIASGEDDLSKLDWLNEMGPPPNAPANQSKWVPEADLLGDLDETEPAADAENIAEASSPEGPQDESEAEPQAEPEPVIEAEQEPEAQPVAEPGLSPDAERLAEARQAMRSGDPAKAMKHYSGLLRRRKLLDEVIDDLKEAVDRSPGDFSVWQALGDAYMRNNQLQDALDCYTKAEDLLSP